MKTRAIVATFLVINSFGLALRSQNQRYDDTIDRPFPVLIVPGILGSVSRQISPLLSDSDGWKLIQDIDAIPGFPNIKRFRTYNELYNHLILSGYAPVGPIETTEWDPVLEDWVGPDRIVVRGANLFPAPYDWRQPNDVTYQTFLMKQIDRAKEISGAEKVNIVAHSMGGLMVRAYIQGPRYRGDIDQFIMLGTPNAGAPDAYFPWEGGVGNAVDLLPFLDKDNYVVFLLILALCGDQYPLDSVTCIHAFVPSLRQLLPDETLTNVGNYLYDFTNGEIIPYDELCIDNRNDFLTNLNRNIDRLFESGVRVTVFGGSDFGDNSFKTLGRIGVRCHGNCDAPIWPDGEPVVWSSFVSEGDGTVLGFSLTAGGKVPVHMLKRAKHRDLPTAFKQEVLEVLTGARSQCNISELTENEPNNNISQANPISPDFTEIGVLCPKGDVDYYWFDASAGQIAIIDIDAEELDPPSDADTVLTLFDSSGNVLDENNDDIRFDTSDSYLQFFVPQSGRYYFRVRDRSDRGGLSFTYQILLTLL